MDDKIGERVVVLETKLSAVEDKQDDILEKLEAITDQLTRYKGFMGGIAFVFSGIVVAWQLIEKWLSRGG